MTKEKTTFCSQVNGLKFDSHNPTTNILLSNHNKSQFVQPEQATKGKGGKAKMVIEGDDVEQDIK